VPARFDTPLIVESLATDERLSARLAAPLVFRDGDGRRLVVPKGFRTDLASIPQIGQALIGKWERHAPAAALHDWLYVVQILPRSAADRTFAVALYAAGVPLWKRLAMWAAVRVFGGRAWRRNRQCDGGDMSRRMPTFDALDDEYRSLWEQMEIRADRLPAITSTARKIIAEKTRYLAIQDSTGVPWFVVGTIHAMECGLRFDRHLHNGDPLTKRTVQVPAGRPEKGTGPFTWEESACDALLMKRLDAIARWDVPRIAFELERYNGWGYRLHHPETLSPYLWSGTKHYSRGKYVKDGVWSATAVSGQSGAMALLKRIAELDASVVLEAAERDPATEYTKTPDVAENSTAPQTMAQSSTGNTAAAIGTGSGGLAAAEVAGAMQRVAQSGKPFSMIEFLLAVAQSPTFWVALFTMLGSVYIWLERRRKLIVHGV
jgi:lysozyme family protein